MHKLVPRSGSEGKRVQFWGSFFVQNVTFVWTKAFKKIFKKVPRPSQIPNQFPCGEAPREAASRAHYSNKKQLFEQKLKHCSRFLQKKLDWAKLVVKKMNELLNHVAFTAEFSNTFRIAVSCSSFKDGDLTRPGPRPGEFSALFPFAVFRRPCGLEKG